MKNLAKRLLLKIKDEKGYIEMILTIVIFFFLVAVLITLAPPFITREKLSIITRRTVNKIEYDGKVDVETRQFVDEQIKKANLTGKNVNYEFTGNIRPDGKIQLRDEFTFSINAEEKINLTGIGVFSMTMPINKSQTGISEVFYKSSEL